MTAAPEAHPRLVLPAAAWIAVVLLVLGLSLRDWSSFQVGGWTDDAKYVLLSRALAHGEPYRIDYGPEPEVASFPFLLPLALTPFTLFAPDTVEAGQLVSLLATLINLTVLFWGWPLLSGLSSRWWGLAAAALYGLSPQIVGMSHMIMAEPLMTCFALLSIVASERAARAKKSAVAGYLAVGFFAVCAFYARTAGIAVIAAVVARALWRHQRQAARPLAGLALGALLLVVPVTALTSVSLDDLVPWLYVRNVPRALDTGEARSPLLAQVAGSVEDYAFFSLRQGLVPVGGSAHERMLGDRLGIPEISAVLSLVVTLLVLLGFAWSCAGGLRSSVLLYEVFYVGVILLWHVRGWRLLLPILPFLSLQLIWGARWLVAAGARAVRLPPRPAQRLVTAAALAAVAVIVLGSLYRVLPRGPSSLRFVRDLGEGTTWLRQRSEPGALVLAEEPASVRLWAERPVIALPQNLSPDAVWQLARRSKARYLLIAPALRWADDGVHHYDDTTAALLPSVEAAADRGEIELVYQSPPEQLVRVYRLGHPQEEAAVAP